MVSFSLQCAGVSACPDPQEPAQVDRETRVPQPPAPPCTLGARIHPRKGLAWNMLLCGGGSGVCGLTCWGGMPGCFIVGRQVGVNWEDKRIQTPCGGDERTFQKVGPSSLAAGRSSRSVQLERPAFQQLLLSMEPHADDSGVSLKASAALTTQIGAFLPPEKQL